MDWAAIILAVKRANAAYIEPDDQSAAAFVALGDTWIAQFQDESHQAVLSVDGAGATHLSISGTRASQGAIKDVIADISRKAVPVKGGTVTDGVYEGMVRSIARLAQRVYRDSIVIPVMTPVSHVTSAARIYMLDLLSAHL